MENARTRRRHAAGLSPKKHARARTACVALTLVSVVCGCIAFLRLIKTQFFVI